MKFLIAPQSMIAVVSMIFVPMESFWSAMSTWLTLQEDDVKATSQSKNPLHQIQRW